eukprot:759945-Hanusia_phi.AAC.1
MRSEVIGAGVEVGRRGGKVMAGRRQQANFAHHCGRIWGKSLLGGFAISPRGGHCVVPVLYPGSQGWGMERGSWRGCRCHNGDNGNKRRSTANLNDPGQVEPGPGISGPATRNR